MDWSDHNVGENGTSLQLVTKQQKPGGSTASKIVQKLDAKKLTFLYHMKGHFVHLILKEVINIFSSSFSTCTVL